MTGLLRVPGMKLLVGVSVALVLAGIGGCGEKTGSRGGEPPSLPNGHTFVSTEVSDGGEQRPLVDGTRIRLSFDGGAMHIDAGCNHLGGHPQLVDHKLVVDGIGGTDMGCSNQLMQQDQWLSEFFEGKPRWQLDGDELTLSSGDLQIRLLERRVAEPDRPLRGTKWVLDTIIDGDTASSAPTDGRAYLEIGREQAMGHDGCNGFDAREVVVRGSDLRMSDVRTQSRGCRGDEEAMARAMSDVLWSEELTFRIEVDRLTLETPAGKGLGFRAG